MAAQSSDQFANTLFDLIMGHRLTAVIYVAAQLRICDLLAEGRRALRSWRGWLTHTGGRFSVSCAPLVALAVCKEAGWASSSSPGRGLIWRPDRSAR